MILGKIWGSTESVLNTPILEMHLLKIKPNAMCSLHCHRFKHNGFAVISGRLFIETHKNDYALIDVTDIGPGEVTSVKPGEYHRFRTGDEPTVALEWYFPEALSEDIVRKDCGSVEDKNV